MSAALLYLAIHSVQFGAQPLLSKHFVQPGTDASSLAPWRNVLGSPPKGSQGVMRRAAQVLGAETAKILGCFAMLLLEGRLHEALQAGRAIGSGGLAGPMSAWLRIGL